MSDDDLIRRGDALRVADEVFDKCENVNGDDRGAFAAAEVGARIAALPAVTIQQITAGPEQCERDLEDTAAQAREAALREAAGVCAGIRQRIANGPMPEGARFDYEQAILALIGEVRT